MVNQYCDAVAEIREALERIATKFDATSGGTMTNLPTKEEERRVARARVHLREIQASIDQFLKSHPDA